MLPYRNTPTRDHTLRSERSPGGGVPTGGPQFPRSLDDHLVSEPIAAGGMASVHVAVSADRRQRVLALKRVHPHLASDRNFTSMLLDEAALASCIRHENVVTTYGADMIGDEVFLVMDYVPGLPLHVLLRTRTPSSIPARFAVAIMADALRGLHAAHEAVDGSGQPLGIVHRDVSPQNILLGRDGIARVLDFGIAKAERRRSDTRVGDLKGKLAYMAPEQLCGGEVDRRSDVYAAAVVLWEVLVGAPLFHGPSDESTFAKALRGCSTRPGKRVSGIPSALDAVVMRGLATRSQDRFATALDMARALDSVFAFNPVRPNELSAWLEEVGADALQKQAQVLADLLRRRSPPPFAVAPAAAPAQSLPARPQRTTAPSRRRLLPPLAFDLSALPAYQQKVATFAVLFVAGSVFGLVVAVMFSAAIGVMAPPARSSRSAITDHQGSRLKNMPATQTSEETP